MDVAKLNATESCETCHLYKSLIEITLLLAKTDVVDKSVSAEKILDTNEKFLQHLTQVHPPKVCSGDGNIKNVCLFYFSSRLTYFQITLKALRRVTLKARRTMRMNRKVCGLSEH